MFSGTNTCSHNDPHNSCKEIKLLMLADTVQYDLELNAYLGQLKLLVQHYKTSNEFNHGPQQEGVNSTG